LNDESYATVMIEEQKIVSVNGTIHRSPEDIRHKISRGSNRGFVDVCELRDQVGVGKLHHE
jgi:hypothetical protein